MTLRFFIFAICFATIRLIDTKNKENRNPPEIEIQRYIMAKLEVISDTKFPTIKTGTPAHKKKVNINNIDAIMTYIKFFLSTNE